MNWEIPFARLETDAERGQLIMAIFEYNRTGQVPKLIGEVKGIFNVIQDTIDKDTRQWKNTVLERAAAGKVGGIKSGEIRRANAQANKANASFAYGGEANEPVIGNELGIDGVDLS